MENYVQNYSKAVLSPLPLLKETYEAELNFLKSFVTKESKVIDFGCGMGRPARDLAAYVKQLVAFDNVPEMLELAKKYCAGKENIILENQDALHTNYHDESFDFVYATYNLIGSVNKGSRLSLIKEMARVAKLGSSVVAITWQGNDSTTEFLKEYYPSIGIDVIAADIEKTITSKGVFARIDRNELLEYYNQAGLKDIEFKEIGPVWLAITGTKV